MSAYHFITRWKTRAPLEAAWEAIYQTDEWPQWWKYVRSVQKLREGNEQGVGSVRRFEWSTALPYRFGFDLETTVSERPHRLHGKAVGELEGDGIWAFRQEGEWVHIQYDWIVRTNKWWMNLFRPLLYPFFVWNHNVVMEAGRIGLGRWLGVGVERVSG